jgi:hypothetical protein
MRTRRQFQPTLEYMPLRMVPSALVSVPDPTDTSADPTVPAPIVIDPADPSATPPINSGPSPVVGPGSYTTPTTSDPTMLC